MKRRAGAYSSTDSAAATSASATCRLEAAGRRAGRGGTGNGCNGELEDLCSWLPAALLPASPRQRITANASWRSALLYPNHPPAHLAGRGAECRPAPPAAPCCPRL